MQLDNEPSSVLPGSSGIVSYVLKVLSRDTYLGFCFYEPVAQLDRARDF